MAEINDPSSYVPDEWPYSFCSLCEHLSPISNEISVKGEPSNRVCLSCHSDVLIGPDNAVVFFTSVEAKLRGLPTVKNSKGEA